MSPPAPPPRGDRRADGGAPPPARPGPERSWRLVLPVKGGPHAKTRLRAVTGGSRELSDALALDCLDAVLACGSVEGAWVVSADAALLARVGAAGARPVPEARPRAGLLAAIADGVAAAASAPGSPDGCAVLLADLPCLLPEDLAAALAQAGDALDAGARQAVVPDAEGSGTVLLAARSPADLRARFGTASAAAHRRDGAVVVGEDLARLRRDVDTPHELARAVALGVGARTAAAVGACPVRVPGGCEPHGRHPGAPERSARGDRRAS